MLPVSTRTSTFLGVLLWCDKSVHVRVHLFPPRGKDNSSGCLTFTVQLLSTKCPGCWESLLRVLWVVSPCFPFFRLRPWYVGVRISIRVTPDAYLAILPMVPRAPTGVAGTLLILVLVFFLVSIPSFFLSRLVSLRVFVFSWNRISTLYVWNSLNFWRSYDELL